MSKFQFLNACDHYAPPGVSSLDPTRRGPTTEIFVVLSCSAAAGAVTIVSLFLNVFPFLKYLKFHRIRGSKDPGSVLYENDEKIHFLHTGLVAGFSIFIYFALAQFTSRVFKLAGF